MPAYPFRNLVFEGGGVKGIAYIGAIEALEEAGILSQIERVAGASAGAITALILSFRLTAQQSIGLLNTLDFAKVPGDDDSPFVPNFIEDDVEHLTGDLKGLFWLWRRFGWHSSHYFYDWLKQTIAGQCSGNPLATFADFQRLGFRDLYVVVTNISTHQASIFSAKTTPDALVADAVRMSMSIPLYFESLQYSEGTFGQGDYYADGGTILNYPIDLFDASRYVDNDLFFHDGINRETLGCYLFTPDNCPRIRKPVTNLLSYFENLIETFLNTQTISLQKRPFDLQRSIPISNQCVVTTDFSIKQGDVKYDKLVAGGKTAVINYLKHYPGK